MTTKLLLIAAILLTSACQPGAPRAPRSVGLDESAVVSPDFATVAGKKIEDVLIVLFLDGMTADEWKRVFDDTRLLSRLRKAAVLGEDNFVEIADALDRIQNAAAYVAAWDVRHGCRFDADAMLTCERAGHPYAEAPLRITVPELRGRAQRPVFELELRSRAPENFSLLLRFRPQPEPGLLAGSAEPLPGSIFLHDGAPVAASTRGYVEIRLAP